MKFKAAAEAYVQRPGDLRPEKLGETYLFQGASQLLNGDVAGAKASFTNALVAEPSLRPDAGLFGQDVQRRVHGGAEELDAQPPGLAGGDSQPQGARVTGARPRRGRDAADGRRSWPRAATPCRSCCPATPRSRRTRR